MTMKFKMKRIIILGSTGYIGKYLLKRFSGDNAEVLGYSSSTCDLLSLEKAREVFSGFTKEDAVLMLSTTNRLDENTYGSMDKNIKMADNVSKLLQEYPIGLLVFFSTIDVYGVYLKVNEIINEKSLPNPNDYYSVSKLASEYLLKMVCLKNNILLRILRLSGVYGPGDKARSTISILLDSAREKKEIQICGKGENLRDFVYIDDIYKIVNLSIKGSGAELLNVATGKSYSIIQIAEILKDALPYSFNIKFVANPGLNTEKRVKNLIFDTTLLKNSFSGLNLTDLREGITLYLSDLSELRKEI